MAEFREVLQKWHEICDRFTDNGGCSEECPCFGNCTDIWEMNVDELEKAEKTVMNYSYQKPIYPTILELVHYIANRLPARNDGKDWARDIPISELVMERIPDDVAEEFELVPINECGLRKYVEDDDIPPSEWR